VNQTLVSDDAAADDEPTGSSRRRRQRRNALAVLTAVVSVGVVVGVVVGVGVGTQDTERLGTMGGRGPNNTQAPVEGTLLSVEVSHPEHPTLQYGISCNGADGPAVTGDSVGLDADAACKALNDQAVIDRLVEGSDPDLMCASVYGSDDVASFKGTIDQIQVNTQLDRRNGCGIYEWDTLFVDLLPAAR
jgi:hypothetical protein